MRELQKLVKMSGVRQRVPLQSTENLPSQSGGASKAKSNYGPGYPKGNESLELLYHELSSSYL